MLNGTNLNLSSDVDQDTYGKVTIYNKTQKNKEVSPFSAGDHKVARNRQDSITKETLPRNGQQIIALEGLNMFNGTNLTFIYDVDQDTYMFGSHEKSLTYQCIIS